MRNCKLMKRKQIKTSPGWSLKIHLNLNCGEKSSNDLSSVMAIWRATWTRPTCSNSSFAEFEGSDTKVALAFLLERKITTKNTFVRSWSMVTIKTLCCHTTVRYEIFSYCSSLLFQEASSSLLKLTAPQVKSPTPMRTVTTEGSKEEERVEAAPCITFVATTLLSQLPSLSKDSWKRRNQQNSGFTWSDNIQQRCRLASSQQRG